MALIQTITGDTKPNWLSSANGMRLKTDTGYQSMGADDGNNRKIIKSGTIYPSNDTNATGIVYEDVDVTKGDYPAAVLTAGFVYENRLPETLASAAKTALESKGIHFETAPEFERSY